MKHETHVTIKQGTAPDKTNADYYRENVFHLTIMHILLSH